MYSKSKLRNLKKYLETFPVFFRDFVRLELKPSNSGTRVAIETFKNCLETSTANL